MKIDNKNINTVPNQKVIETHKEKCDANHLYGQFNLKALEYASIMLDGNAFKLWCYINKNQNGYKFALSKVDALKFGIGSKSSYDRSVAKLIKEGFLVETSPNHYDFYEMPTQQGMEITVNKIITE